MTRHAVRHRRRSIRLRGYDYSRNGAYFVTICVKGRACLFGTVVNGEVLLNEYGRQVADCWVWLAERYPYVRLDQWIVMPNHVHGIMVITDDHHGGADHTGNGLDVSDPNVPRRGGSRTARTHPIRPPTGGPYNAPTNRKTLGRLIGAFKTVSTRRINDLRSTPGAKALQRNYYECVIRNGLQMRRVRRYIANNPSRWEVDPENRGRMR